MRIKILTSDSNDDMPFVHIGIRGDDDTYYVASGMVYKQSIKQLVDSLTDEVPYRNQKILVANNATSITSVYEARSIISDLTSLDLIGR
jgi:hypothetical protein